ncbi:Myosin-8 [Mycoblastus sanguinarius]|nr:Myosin-8 [Mycoblastus sanguinarius]
MGEIHPSQITQKSLVAVASYTLCKRYHSKDDDQVLDKVDEWQNKIEDYLDQCDKPQAESADLVGEVQQLRKELEEAKQQIQSNSAIKHLQQQFKTTRKNLDDTTQELDRATAHNIKLAQQFLKLQTQIDDANRTAMELREHITARDERIKDVKAESAEVVGDLEGQLAEKNSTIKALEETNLASHKEIEALQQQSAEEIGDLEGQLAEKDSTIRALEETNQESNSEIDILRRYFEERNTESNAKVSDLQQENRRLKAQKHFQLFRKQVQLVFKKRRCEYAETENRTLSEQLERMIKQLGDRDMQVAEHDRTLSFFNLKNVRTGLCAVAAIQPPKLSVRKIQSLISRPSSPPYIHPAVRDHDTSSELMQSHAHTAPTATTTSATFTLPTAPTASLASLTSHIHKHSLPLAVPAAIHCSVG